MHKYFHIAIDGPVAAGKGTISRIVAQRLKYLYVDTGAMYRMAALLAIKNKVEICKENEDQIVSLIQHSKMEMTNPSEIEKDGRLTTVFLDGEDVSWKIRTEEISQGSSKVSTLPKIRKELVAKQQVIAQTQDVIMEGRDITYRVLPDADLKIYLTGQDDVRARRRHLEYQIKGIDVSYEEVHKELMIRDERDMNRDADPLQIVDDAWVIDTSELSIESVVEMIVSKVKMLKTKKES